MMLSDKTLVESESGAEDVELMTRQSNILVWFLKRPGLPLSVVAATMNHVLPKVPIVLLSDCPEPSEETFQTVDAIGSVSDQPFFPPTLQPFLVSEPVAFLATNGKSTPGVDPASVLEDLRSALFPSCSTTTSDWRNQYYFCGT
jgi:hypothetical protein